MARSKAWAELGYRELPSPCEPALDLFRFAGAWAPAREQIEWGWGAWHGERVCAALLVEKSDTSALLHGPVVVAPPEASSESALEAASEMLEAALQHAAGQGIDTVFTRPQGLDRIWVRHGFIPVPEAELPAPLRRRPGVGLFGWRGGTALWSAAGRGAPRRLSAARR